MRTAVIAFICLVVYGFAQDGRPKRATYYPAYNTNLVRDMSGNGNTVMNYGASLYETSSGWVGKFDGTDYLMLYTNSVGLGITTNAAYSAWVNITNSLINDIIGDFDQGNLAGMILRVQSGYRSEILVYPNNYRATSTNTIPAGTWTMLTGVLEGTNISLYINDELVATAPLNGPVGQSGKPLRIGMRGDGLTWPTTGKIKDVKIYDISITSNDVSNLYASGTITNEPTAYWTMQPEYQ